MSKYIEEQTKGLKCLVLRNVLDEVFWRSV
jgi:hypothetical protein